MSGRSVVDHAPMRGFFASLHRLCGDSSPDDSLSNSSYHRSSATMSRRLVDTTPAPNPDRKRCSYAV